MTSDQEAVPSPRPGTDSPRGVLATTAHLLRCVSRHRAATWILVATLVVDVTFASLLPLSLKFLIDHALVPHDAAILRAVIWALAAGMILNAVAALIRDYQYAWLAAHVLHDLRLRMFAQLQRLPLSFYARASAGDLLSRFSTDLGSVENALVLGMPCALASLMQIVLSTAVLFFLEWRLALLAFLGLPFCLVGPRLLGPRAAKAGAALRDQSGGLAGCVQENLGGQAVVKAFNLQRLATGSFTDLAERLRPQAIRFNFLSFLTERSPDLTMTLFNVLIIGGGAWLAFRGSLSIGSLVSFQAVFVGVYAAVVGITSVTVVLLQATGGLQRVTGLLETKVTIADAPDAKALPRLTSAIDFDRVTFSHDGSRNSLENVSLTISAGTRNAFVGASGCGKSTSLSLLLRFHDPDSGCIRWDGTDLKQGTLASLYDQVGVVLQESFLFNTTIRENIRLGKTDATDAEVEAAARAADLHEIVSALPQQYDTLVGERGSRLSGGQRQRVALARALVRDPAVLLLDEATSALDPATEATINATLRRVARARTVVNVTHRLDAIVDYDRIFVFAAGQLVEQGRHVELLARRGAYHALWSKQAGLSLSGDGETAMIEPDRLAQVAIFQDMPAGVREWIATRLTTEHFEAGRNVMVQGEPGRRLYIIVRGKVAVSVARPDGAEQRVAVLTDGDYLGEMSLLSRNPVSATVQALEPSVCLSLPREHFLRLLQESPALSARIAAMAEKRAAVDREILDCSGASTS